MQRQTVSSLHFQNRTGRVRLKGLLIISVVALCGWGYLSLFEEPKSVPKPAAFSSPYKNTRPDVAYVGDQVCARCHAEIAKTFRQHPMGRSRMTPEKILPEASGKVLEFQDLTYWIERRDGRVFHQERETSQAGHVVEKTEHPVRYVIGAGERSYAFLVERGDGLFLSPISWNAWNKAWDLPPGYRKRNQHFDREIKDDCLFCHVNRFERVEGKPIQYHEMSNSCERCHGPGSLHAEHPNVVNGKDLTIVNPADLRPASLRENVCEQCHFQGYQRNETHEGSSFDYRPGLSLETFFHITAERPNLTRRNRAVGHVEQMRSSRCYIASKEELGCISCHDPHRRPEPSTRVAFYQKRCLNCHGPAGRGCILSPKVRLEQSPKNDCVSCHMPPLPMSDSGHGAATNHTIPRNP